MKSLGMTTRILKIVKMKNELQGADLHKEPACRQAGSVGESE
jgi:hypothetical protein